LKLSILHDQNGQVLAMSRIDSMRSKLFVKAGMLPKEGQFVTEIELDRELESIPLHQLHENYRVDIENSRLVRR
jgi:hypothetical protein